VRRLVGPGYLSAGIDLCALEDETVTQTTFG
jgi:hypothetical protein